MRWAALGPLLPALLIAGCVMFGFRRGDLAEEVPQGYAGLPLAPGWHEIRPETIDDVNRICRSLGVAANDQYRPATIMGCAVPSIHAVIMPVDGVLDPEKQQAEQDHEYLHSWGAVHGSGGRGWLNLPPLSQVFPQANALQPAPSLAQLPATQPNALAPIPRGLFGSSAR